MLRLVHLWIYMAIAAAALLALYGLLRWAASAPEIDADADKERFRAQQDWRALRRSGVDASPPQAASTKK